MTGFEPGEKRVGTVGRSEGLGSAVDSGQTVRRLAETKSGLDETAIS